MTIRHFLIWYVGSLVFVATTGASGYRALERLHGHDGATPQATAAPPQPTQQLAAAEPVVAPAAPDPPARLPPLPALRQHAAALPAPKVVHRATASAPLPTRGPAPDVAVTQRAPVPAPQPDVASHRPVGSTYAYYPYRPYYAYGSGYAYVGGYARYPYYYVR